ncbi:Uncharacterised protein [Mycobacteroides abscessus subsp. abscessus]|uniref:hypothetical protein n=2 Tax=Mycobacteroides abscessus TaxID=36809 RepID=UPI0009277D39|nr:hypothetical protein [Mycobacteroides abscessus]SIC59309.1 Uncharacterised protein [Mycobacteroides abscessus subsp. abscessus]SIC90908.1 Uncharacterised protein [Mycobacteroides abscessus subsp. abscessus]SID10849.1 Uncharacterised protein [Mycobacteroides abscessus subsp. abscessus]SID18179.1 Uncharacterised protein [Mycobacteroides abscessus subsp. abscessus]SKT52984.1 Uncharacterised protein [Mycobacteroides abscessus subsp. abscessus]
MSTRRRKDWTPYGVPQIAAKTAEINAPYLEQLKATSQHPGIASLERELELLNASPTLHWMNKSAVMVAAGLAEHGIPDHTLAEVLASGNIAPNGFICFEKPIRKVPWHYGLNVAWDAMAWGTLYVGSEPRFAVGMLSRMTGFRDRINLLRSTSPLIGVGGMFVDFDEVMTQAEIRRPDHDDGLKLTDEYFIEITRMIASVLLTIGQPRMVSQKVLDESDGVVHTAGAEPNAREVILIDLLRPPREASGNWTRRNRKEHDHRWWVRGHYKMQPYGPQNSKRKLIFVWPHTKGPADKPLDNRPRINIIRPDQPRQAGHADSEHDE